MLKASVKISSPVLGSVKLQNIKCRNFHVSQTKSNTLAKSIINPQKTTIFQCNTHNNKNDKRWGSSSNTHAEGALEFQSAKKQSHSASNDVPQQYANYVSTENLAGALAQSGAAALAIALVLLYLQSEEKDEAAKTCELVQKIKPQYTPLLDAGGILSALKTLKELRAVTPEQAQIATDFVMEVIQRTHRADIVVECINVLKMNHLRLPAMNFPITELIQKLTKDEFIQQIPVQAALVDFIGTMALKRMIVHHPTHIVATTRSQIATPFIIDYAELMINHSEESVSTKAAHILLSLARSNEHIEMLGGTVQTLWNLIFRNKRDEAVGYAKEALSLINARKAATKNAEFKETVTAQIQAANIHPEALAAINGYKNTHLLAGSFGTNVATALLAAGWGLVRWHTQLARSAHHIDTPTARKIVSMRLLPTVLASVALLNFANMTGFTNQQKINVPQVALVVFTGATMSSIVPYCVAPAVAGSFWTRFWTRNCIVKDVEYQY